jgi:hypothetical protein
MPHECAKGLAVLIQRVEVLLVFEHTDELIFNSFRLNASESVPGVEVYEELNIFTFKIDI